MRGRVNAIRTFKGLVADLRDIMPHGNKTGMDYTIQLSTKNYELRKLH